MLLSAFVYLIDINCLMLEIDAYLCTKSFVPTNTDPTGAPTPLLRHRDTLSQPRTSLAGATLRATAALRSRAPSMCIGSFRPRQVDANCQS